MGSNDNRREKEMFGREFVKRLRLLHGRSATIRTRFELDKAAGLLEHVTVETHGRNRRRRGMAHRRGDAVEGVAGRHPAGPTRRSQCCRWVTKK